VQHNHQQAFDFTNMGYNQQQLDILNQIFVKGDRFLLPQPQFDRMGNYIYNLILLILISTYYYK